MRETFLITLIFGQLLLPAQIINSGGHRKVFPSSGGTPPALVGTPVCNKSGGSALTVSYSPTSGNGLMTGVGFGSATATISTVKDSSGASFTEPNSAPVRTPAGAARSGDAWAKTSVGAGITGVVITPSTSVVSVGCVAEFSNVTGVGNPVTATYTTTGTYTVSVTLANANDIAFCSITASSSITAETATNGTIIASELSTGALFEFIQTNTSASAGAVTVSGTLTPTNTSGAITCFDIQ